MNLVSRCGWGHVRNVNNIISMKKVVKKKSIKKEKFIWTKNIRSKIRSIVIEYRRLLMLPSYTIDLSFCEESKKNEDSGWITLAETTGLDEYMTFRITFFKDLCLKYKQQWEEALRSTIKHEMCHFITWKLMELALERHVTEKEIMDATETLTQKISILIKDELPRKTTKRNNKVNKVLAKRKK